VSNTAYRWLNEISQVFLNRDYLGDLTLDARADVICFRAEEILGIPGFASRFKENLRKGWYSLSTPVWANFGNDRGLPISCNGSFVGDSMDSILYTHAEIGMMSKHGAGTSAYFGALRGRKALIRGNGVSSGSVQQMRMFDVESDVVNQGSTRRGSNSPSLDIDHPDIMDFLDIRREGHPIQKANPGVCVSDAFMKAMYYGDEEKQRVWAKALKSRSDRGFPYIFFTDNANNSTVDVYRDRGMKIHHSNLCQEIMLPDSEEESFVCCISSMNILHYDEWRNTDAVELMIFFLDAVLEEYIQKLQDIRFLERALRFARRHRALGLGWLGWHSYLQSKGIPFESFAAMQANTDIAITMKEQAYAASAKLAKMFGEPELLVGYGRRNTTLLAIAPTQSSSMIIGQASEGIQPRWSNYYVKDTAKGQFTIRNPELVPVLEAHGKNTEDVWMSILLNRGSVRHLDFLSDHEKEVFKTYREISPKTLIQQAASRQKHIDQGQSLNLFVHPDTAPREENELLFYAWDLGIKSLYYHQTNNAAEDKARELFLNKQQKTTLPEIEPKPDYEECLSCSA
jgi:ribonucleoside-diphosphate reductase alpha chain